MGGMRVSTSCLNLSQHSVPHSSFTPQTLASVMYSSEQRSLTEGFLRHANKMDRSVVFGYSSKIYRTRSCEMENLRCWRIRRACCASMEDEEFSKKIQELALQFQLSGAADSTNNATSESYLEVEGNQNKSPFYMSRLEPVEPPDWQDIISGSIERKVNSVELPFSLRMIKKKKQWKQGFVEVGESACSSVKKAFSSMVLIIRELQSYTMQMREVLFYEDLQGILVRVQKEMNVSFVWLFQQVFSHTPTLKLYVMILLANYSVHSMASNTALSAAAPSLSLKFDYHRTVVPDGASSIVKTGEEESVSDQVSGEEELSLWNSVVEEASSMQAVLRDESLDHETIYAEICITGDCKDLIR